MLVYSDEIKLDGALPPNARSVYNALDCCITAEVFEALKTQASASPLIYNFERALQAPVLDMMLRGWKIDGFARSAETERLRLACAELERWLQEMAYAVWFKPLNANSPKQLIDFFYGHMKLPEQYEFKKGRKTLSTGREALEKLELYLYARPIVSTILEIRNIKKLLSVLETDISADGRFRTSFNIAGTETGRFSSSASSDGTGSNIQNITGDLRRMFVADDGMYLIGIDLEQAESREVGWLCGTLFDDWSYLDACYAGDLHTLVSTMAFRDLPWTNDRKANRKLADQPFYRHLSRRDLSKKLGHGSNYYGQPTTMARHAKITPAIARDFQENYFAAFPGIPKWHRWTAEKLQRERCLSTVFGRQRHFFGRPNDDATLREAIAFQPQSATADRMNLGLWRIWKHLRGDGVALLAQVHDAVYAQVPLALHPREVVPKMLELIDIRISCGSRELVVPGEAKVGFNWGNHSDANPNGLRKYSPDMTLEKVSLLDLPL